MQPDIQNDEHGNVRKRPANFCSNYGISKKKAKNNMRKRRRSSSSSEIPSWMKYQEMIEPDQTIKKERCIWERGSMMMIGKKLFLLIKIFEPFFN